MADRMTYAGRESLNGDWFAFMGGVLDSLGHASKPSKKRGEYAAGWWDFRVPHSLQFVRVLLSYVDRQRLDVDINGESIGWVSLGDVQPRAINGGIEIESKWKLGIHRPAETRRDFLAYPDARTAALCTGQWVDLGTCRLKLGSMLPTITRENGAVWLRWSDPPQIELGQRGYFGWFRRVTRTTLSGIKITEVDGEFEVSGLGDWVLPRLVWCE